MLRVDGLSVSYGGIHAVRSASLEAADGVITSVIGRNGAGKSSLVQAIAGLVRAEGSVSIDGVELGRRPASARARAGISLVPEDRRVFGSLTVRENLALAAGTRLDAERLDFVLAIFPKLKQLMGHGGHEISGGEQQMVAIARGLLREPKFLVLDEPSLGLAPLVVEEVFRAIARVVELGQSVLLIEQNAVAALDVSAAAYSMSLGRLESLGSGPFNLDRERLQELYL